MATRTQKQQAAAAAARAEEVERARLSAQADLQAGTDLASRQARLVERILHGIAQQRASAEVAAVDPGGLPMVPVLFVRDGGGTIGDRIWQGKEGEVQLLPEGAAEVLRAAGVVGVGKPLSPQPWLKPEIASELRAVAAQLQQAADQLDPQEA